MASPYLDAGMTGSREQATGYLNQQAKQRGRGPLTDQEWSSIASQPGINYTGGNVSGQQVNSAIDYLGWGSGGQQPGPNPPPQQPLPPAPVDPAPQPPAGGVDPNAALGQVNQIAQQRFNRGLNPQEIPALQNLVGAPAGPNGTYTAQQVQAAKDYVSRYSGRLDDPWGAVTPPPAPKTLTQSVEQGIQQRIDQPIGFNPDDPIFKGQTAAFQRASDRDTARKRAELAERSAARGTLNAGGFDVDTERILTEQGQNEQAFETQLAGTELRSQRDQVMRALELGAGRLSDTERNALAERLAQLDAALRREGLALQGLLGNRSLNIQERGQSNQNNQFYDQLGASIGLNQAQLNQNAILQLLNG
jgi:hypothetical protein